MHSTDQRTTEIARILVERAPCFFCGYNGAGFFQPGTHAGSCPWAGVGGDDARYAVLPTVLSDLLSRLRTVEEERDRALPYMRAIQNRHNGYGAGVPGVYEPRSPKEALDALLEEAEAMGRLESVVDLQAVNMRLRVAGIELDRARQQRDALVEAMVNALNLSVAHGDHQSITFYLSTALRTYGIIGANEPVHAALARLGRTVGG